MSARDALHVVLSLRRHKEDVEERRLGDILREKAKCHAELERIAAELEQITAVRLRQIQHIQNGLHHQECDAAMRQLSESRTEMLARIDGLDQQRVQQMSVYVAARCDREVIEEVRAKCEALRETERCSREQKRDEELFLARRIRVSDTSAAEKS
jgi:flagellar export protein FliJ